MTHASNHQSPNRGKLKEFQEFVFIGNTSAELTTTSTSKLPLTHDRSWLNKNNIGNFLLITQICATKNVMRQLRNVHFKPGKTVELVNKTHNGSVVVKLDNKLIGIGSEIAQKIIVTSAN